MSVRIGVDETRQLLVGQNNCLPSTGHRVIDKWLSLPWSEESIEDYRKFGKASALLYHFLNYEVVTPQGKGVLLQVLGKKCYAAFCDSKAEIPEAKHSKHSKKEGDKGRFAGGRYYYCWEVRPLFDSIKSAPAEAFGQYFVGENRLKRGNGASSPCLKAEASSSGNFC